LLLPASDDLAYSPSKVYPSFMTGRPIPALAHHGSLLADLPTRLRRTELVLLVAPGRPPTGIYRPFRPATTIGSTRISPPKPAPAGNAGLTP
jgi:hypothetical protein